MVKMLVKELVVGALIQLACYSSFLANLVFLRHLKGHLELLQAIQEEHRDLVVDHLLVLQESLIKLLDLGVLLIHQDLLDHQDFPIKLQD